MMPAAPSNALPLGKAMMPPDLQLRCLPPDQMPVMKGGGDVNMTAVPPSWSCTGVKDSQ
jgi:hypothetical protein